jgi:hypothetical protein
VTPERVVLAALAAAAAYLVYQERVAERLYQQDRAEWSRTLADWSRA